MENPTTTFRVQAWLTVFGEQVVVVLVFMMAIGMVFGVIRGVVDFTARQHWILGIVVAILLLGLLIVLQVLLRKAFSSPRWKEFFWGRTSGESVGLIPKYQGLSTVLLLVLIVSIAILLMATISSILHSQTELVKYTLTANKANIGHGAPPAELTSKLLDYYGWHAIDAIPVLDVWKIFKVEPPLTSEGVLSGFLVLFFRVIIVAQSISLVRGDLALRKQPLKQPLAKSESEGE